MTDNLLPCPFCGGDARNDAHADDCYFILHKAMVNAPNADLSMVPDVLKAWNRRAALAQAQSLPAELAQTVYAFRHSSCTHEEAMCVVSLHSKHSDAVAALEAHKSARKAEWDEAYNSVFEDEATAAWCKKWVERHPWSDEKGSGSECWDTCAMQVDVGVLAASPAQPKD